MSGVPRQDLAAEYLFNANAQDTSGHGHHGDVYGAVPAGDRFGRANAAYRFDGQDDYIVVTPPPALRDRLTVSVWACYADQVFDGWNNCVICQDNGDDEDTSRRVFQLSTRNDRIVWHRMVQASDPVSLSRVVPGVWLHLAAVFTGDVHRLYINGVFHGASRHGLKVHAGEPLYIGRKGTSEPYFFFNGAIDDVRIYRRALTDPEVQALSREGGFEPQQQLGAAEWIEHAVRRLWSGLGR